MVIKLICSSLMITLSAVALSEFNQEALCQCNSKCKDFGDCCMDYEEVCLKSCKGLCRNGEQVKRENVVGFEIFLRNICSVTHANLQFYLLSLHFTFYPGYNPSLDCQCNNKCGFYGNCCDDYKEVCNNGGGIGNISSGSCHGLCGNGELGKMAKLYPSCILRMLNIWARFDACMGIF